RMTNQWLASAADLAVWATMGLLALAMLAFAGYLAVHATAAQRRPARGATSSRGGTETVTTQGVRPGGLATLTEAPQNPASPGHAGRRWGVIGLQLTWLATFALVAGAVMRGLSVSRAPLGNMY